MSLISFSSAMYKLQIDTHTPVFVILCANKLSMKPHLLSKPAYMFLYILNEAQKILVLRMGSHS
jgi:hypothetical protein